MSLITELSAKPGVLAAGEYTYRGDRFTYEGKLDEEMARMASIMCRATTMGVHMQVDMMKGLNVDCGCSPARGWMVRGDQFSVCVVGNIFCFIQNGATSVNEIMRLMMEKVEDQSGQLV